MKTRNSSQKIDLTGQRFGRWTVLEQAAPGEGYSTRWLCECDCGTIKTVDAQLLRSGRSQSCGCLQEEIRLQSPHSLVDGDIRLRMIYRSIVGACEDPRNIKYDKFGAKGARVCDEWRNDFKAFEKWSMEHGYEAGAFLLRYDVLRGQFPRRRVPHKFRTRSRWLRYSTWLSFSAEVLRPVLGE